MSAKQIAPILGCHDWTPVSSETLASSWFHGSVSKMAACVRDFGQTSHLRASVQFVKEADPQSQFNRHIIVLITAADVMVPLLLQKKLRWHEQYNELSLLSALRLRLSEVGQALVPLRKRYNAMLHQGQRFTEQAGNGAKVTRLILQPSDLFSQQPTLCRQPFMVTAEILGDNLCPKPVVITTSMAAEVGKALLSLAPTHRRRMEIRKRRLAKPGYVETDGITCFLLSFTGTSISDVVSLPDGRTIVGSDAVKVHGSTLMNIRFQMSDGYVSVRFNFVGGSYKDGSIFLKAPVPVSIQESLVGRPLHEVICGGIFDLCDLKIIGLGNLTTYIRLQVEQPRECVPIGTRQLA